MLQVFNAGSLILNRKLRGRDGTFVGKLGILDIDFDDIFAKLGCVTEVVELIQDKAT